MLSRIQETYPNGLLIADSHSGYNVDCLQTSGDQHQAPPSIATSKWCSAHASGSNWTAASVVLTGLRSGQLEGIVSMSDDGMCAIRGVDFLWQMEASAVSSAFSFIISSIMCTDTFISPAIRGESFPEEIAENRRCLQASWTILGYDSSVLSAFLANCDAEYPKTKHASL